MELVFTKRSGKYDRLEIRREACAPEQLDCPKQGLIPHEMVHYAVEHTLSAHGFLGRVRDGEAAAFRMAAEPVSDGVERLVEVIQGDGWSGGSSPAEDLLELYALTCSARGCAPLPVAAGAIDAIRAAMADLGRQWDALPVGGAMTLTL